MTIQPSKLLMGLAVILMGIAIVITPPEKKNREESA
jgi:hypothetical protein